MILRAEKVSLLFCFIKNIYSSCWFSFSPISFLAFPSHRGKLLRIQRHHWQQAHVWAWPFPAFIHCSAPREAETKGCERCAQFICFLSESWFLFFFPLQFMKTWIIAWIKWRQNRKGFLCFYPNTWKCCAVLSSAQYLPPSYVNPSPKASPSQQHQGAPTPGTTLRKD